jgi:hypothetical protein
MATKAKKSGKAKSNRRTAQQLTTTRKSKTIRLSGEPHPDERRVGLEFVIPPDLPIHYVDNVSVLHTQTEFVISFLQVQPPIVPEESDLDKVKIFQSRCVARVVLNPLKMQALLNVLNTNFQRYIASYSEQEADNAENRTQTSNNA